MSTLDRMSKPHVRLNIISYEENGKYVSHCLEMDLVATNTTQKKALDDVIDLIKAQIVFAIENDNSDYLYKSAPFQIWAKIKTAKKCDSRMIRISAQTKRTRSAVATPISEVELCIA